VTFTRTGAAALPIISLALLACARPLSQENRPGAATSAPAGREASRSDPQPILDRRLAVLPVAGELDGLTVIDSPRLFMGEALFDLIDGGAVQYFDYGFEWAAAATYRLEGVCDVGVEAYRMTSSAAATGVYEERAGGSVESAEVGEDSRVVQSSVEFRKGSFFVLVTAYQTGQAARNAAKQVARVVEGRLPAD
jgi:hypothetical protein